MNFGEATAILPGRTAEDESFLRQAEVSARGNTHRVSRLQLPTEK